MPGREPENIAVRPARASDAARVAEIYNHYVAHTVVTFEEEEISAAEALRRMEAVQAASLFWFVAERAGEVAGYAYAGKWMSRSAYRFSTELSVYLDPAHTGRRIGSALYRELIPALRDRGIHATIGGIALPNEASIALHQKFGFTKVAHFPAVGFKFDRWIDVGYWQRTF